MTRVIVTGSKNFNDYTLLRNKLDTYLKDLLPNVVIVSGEDEVGICAEKYGVERDLDIINFSIDWEKYGKSAAFKRNEIMFKSSNQCIIFWDGKSKETGFVIGNAKKYGLGYKVFRY